MYLGALFMLAVTGPALGYMLGSGIIKIWVEFDRYETSITPEDPRLENGNQEIGPVEKLCNYSWSFQMSEGQT